MFQVKKYTEELSNLDPDDVKHIFFNLLKNKTVSFTDLSKVYVDYLESNEKENKNLICELGFSLVMFKEKQTGGTWEQANKKASKALIRSGLFAGTLYEKKLIKQTKTK